MSTILGRAAVFLVPTLALLAVSALSYLRNKTLPSFLQLIGTSFLFVVVLAHLCEAFSVLPSMGWGQEGSPGHYLDLSSAVLGVVFFVIGSVLSVARKGSM